MIKIFKTKSQVNPGFMKEIFKHLNVSYNLWRVTDTLLPAVRTTIYEIETVKFIVNKLWQILLPSLNAIPNIEKFKKGLRSWRSNPCNCRICKIFIDDLGFLYISK